MTFVITVSVNRTSYKYFRIRFSVTRNRMGTRQPICQSTYRSLNITVLFDHRFVSLEQPFITIRKSYINYEILSDVNILYNLLNSLK